MSELIVIGFKKDMYRASKVLNELIELNHDWAVDLHGAVAAYRDYRGRLRVDRGYDVMTAGQGAGLGGFLGLVIGTTLATLTLAIPLLAASSAAAAGGALASGAITGTAIGAGVGASKASCWKEEFGITDHFIEEVKALIEPGDSAIFAMLRIIEPDIVAEQFRGYGGTILRTTLTPEQQAKVENVLRGYVGA